MKASSRSVKLVAGTTRDITRVLAMARAFHEEDRHPLTPAGETALARLLAGERLGRLWLVEEGGLLCGYAILTLGFSVEFGGPDVFLDELYIVPSARGRGLGAQTLALLDAEARTLGAVMMHLGVEPHNDRVLRLYERHGFRNRGVRLYSKAVDQG